MANTENEATYIFDSKKSIPNKLLQEDGTITDFLGNIVTNPVDIYNSKVAIPNKFLNSDGTYSTLSEIIAGAVDTELFIVVEELPPTGEPNKIYLLVNGDKLIEYIWINDTWDPIGMVEFDINNYYTKTETNTNFLKKDNTTAYTPSANYHPATKKYVDDNAVSFKPFPNTFVTDGTTQQFLNSITGAGLTAGMVYLGQVSLSDMPQGVTVQAEVEVYIYPQNVAYCVMRSAEVSPYQWEVNSYDNRGWEPIGKAYADGLAANYDPAGSASNALTNAESYADTNFLKKDNTTAYTPSANYHPATKKYVDDAISTNITQALEGSY